MYPVILNSSWRLEAGLETGLETALEGALETAPKSSVLIWPNSLNSLTIKELGPLSESIENC